MKIALIGASGFVGSAILQEAVSRGHQVTAIAGLTHQCLYFEQPHTFEQILFIQTA
ncbi:NAD-dependent epimerase/dehydratase family protein, partial [Aeromonas caviae]